MKLMQTATRDETDARTSGFRSLGHWSRLLYVLAGLAAVAVPVAVAWVIWLGGSPSSPQIPKELGGVALVRTETGPDAMAEVGGMHAGTFTLQDAWIAVYEQGATVWVGEAKSEAEAEQLLQAMVSAIGRGGSPFSSPVQTVVSGKFMFTTKDGKQQHFFYSTGKRVVWAAAPSGDGMRFIQAVAAFLK